MKRSGSPPPPKKTRASRASCCGPVGVLDPDVEVVMALAGNPNVGKSTVFNRYTGLGVVTANYPGKTVELNIGTTEFAGKKIGVIDLPGTYALGAISEDQWVARQAVLDGTPDVVVAILDASNLARNLYMTLQFSDLGIPIVIGLNLIDSAESKGIKTDSEKLAEILGIPVVETIATQGKGLDALMESAVNAAEKGCRPEQVFYGADIESKLGELERSIEKAYAPEENACGGRIPLSPRALSILLLEGDAEYLELAKEIPESELILSERKRLAARLEAEHGEPASVRIARERYGLAGEIASRVQSSTSMKETFAERLWRYSTAPWSGLAILAAVLAVIFGFLFFIGERLAGLVGWAWSLTASPLIKSVIGMTLGHGILAKSLTWGFDAGLEASLTIGLPYVLTFYFLIAFLEDTGYLNSVAFLSDRLMHRLGLHGRAVIPLVAAAGCNVPAIIGTRVLSTQRERVIASTLIVLVPCSARTAVIMGTVAFFVGWQAAAAIFLITSAIILISGLLLNRMMPGKPTGLVMEMFPFRAPSLIGLTKKTWRSFKDFIFVAVPIVLTGSFFLGLLYESGWIWWLAKPLSPVVEGWLDLPAIAGLTLIFAVLRKELALQLLVALAAIKYGGGAHDLLKFMSAKQIFTYALVNTLYIPCAGTIAVLWKELGWRRTLGISAFTMVLATTIGGIASRLYGIF